MKNTIRFIALCLLACTASAVSLCWRPSPSAGVVGYRIYYGPQSGAYTNYFNVGNVTNVTLNLTPGIYFMAATAYDTNSESDFSAEIVYTNSTPLMPPSDFRLWLNMFDPTQ